MHSELVCNSMAYKLIVLKFTDYNDIEKPKCYMILQPVLLFGSVFVWVSSNLQTCMCDILGRQSGKHLFANPWVLKEVEQLLSLNITWTMFQGFWSNFLPANDQICNTAFKFLVNAFFYFLTLFNVNILRDIDIWYEKILQLERWPKSLS